MEQELVRAIGRIEGKLEAMHEDVLEIKQEAQETNGRVTSLEAHRDRQRGAVAVLSMLAAAVGSFLTMLFRG
jgi:hypothetical protein